MNTGSESEEIDKNNKKRKCSRCGSEMITRLPPGWGRDKEEECPECSKSSKNKP